mgnify:CR=1 FL=1
MIPLLSHKLHAEDNVVDVVTKSLPWRGCFQLLWQSKGLQQNSLPYRLLDCFSLLNFIPELYLHGCLLLFIYSNWCCTSLLLCICTAHYKGMLKGHVTHIRLCQLCPPHYLNKGGVRWLLTYEGIHALHCVFILIYLPHLHFPPTPKLHTLPLLSTLPLGLTLEWIPNRYIQESLNCINTKNVPFYLFTFIILVSCSSHLHNLLSSSLLL